MKFPWTKQDESLRTDPEFPTVVTQRIQRVMETHNAFYAQDAEGWDVASLPKPTLERVACPSTYDWDNDVWLDCPNHTGTFCPGHYFQLEYR